MTKLRKRIAAVSLMAFMAIMMALPAWATPPTTESVISDGFSELTGLITGTIAVAFFAILAVVLGLIVGARWLSKGVKQG